jgi:hypothetical protein
MLAVVIRKIAVKAEIRVAKRMGVGLLVRASAVRAPARAGRVVVVRAAASAVGADIDPPPCGCNRGADSEMALD